MNKLLPFLLGEKTLNGWGLQQRCADTPESRTNGTLAPINQLICSRNPPVIWRHKTVVSDGLKLKADGSSKYHMVVPRKGYRIRSSLPHQDVSFNSFTLGRCRYLGAPVSRLLPGLCLLPDLVRIVHFFPQHFVELQSLTSSVDVEWTMPALHPAEAVFGDWEDGRIQC